MTESVSPWLLVAVAIIATFLWRALGVVVSGRVKVDTPLFEWFVCITQALVGGLMVRALVFPSTALAAVPLLDRSLAAAVGVAVFVVLRRTVLIGVLAGVGTVIALVLWRAA